MTRPTKEVENYTQPFLWMACLLLFMALCTIWAVYNFAISLISGVIIHHVISRFPAKD